MRDEGRRDRRQEEVRLRASERVAVAYALILIGVCVVFRARIPSWPWFAAGHALVPILTLGLARWRSRSVRFARDFILVLVIPACFFLLCPLIHRVHPADADRALIELDRAIGGITLLRAMREIESPWLTLLSHAFWLSYYGLPLIPVAALYRRRNERDFEDAKLVLVLTWLASFVGYLLVPAQGPGYHQAEVAPQPSWPGACLELNRVIFALEGEARDTFPSGHAAIAGATLILCARHRLGRLTWLVAPLAVGVVWSTVYLRYHYVVDVLAGLLLAVLADFLVAQGRRRRRGRETAQYVQPDS